MEAPIYRLGHALYGGSWVGTGTWWTAPEKTFLSECVAKNASLEAVADALGRTPKSVANRVREMRLAFPKVWLPARPPRLNLAYPFIAKRRDEHADLLAVNGLVPQGMPGREDVCQELLLAVLEGSVSVAALKSDRAFLRATITRLRRENFESGGYAISLDEPRPDGRTWYDTLSANPWERP